MEDMSDIYTRKKRSAVFNFDKNRINGKDELLMRFLKIAARRLNFPPCYNIASAEQGDDFARNRITYVIYEYVYTKD